MLKKGAGRKRVFDRILPRQDGNDHTSVKLERARTTSLVRCDMSLCANMGYKSGLRSPDLRQPARLKRVRFGPTKKRRGGMP